ncbi:hypothetical protein [Enterovirga sp.]|uniref:hypothetical protein n=1 Tax=Enterovirga sp. TaxID=2026350 RepID=UPI002C4DDCC7|nr:hypothetical protein [Enterovirga sp.]HMO28545.1 hypothetical protein [Enterovirga sp.]
MADLFKHETVVPTAFRVAGRAKRASVPGPIESAVRRECRDAFRRTNLLERIIPTMEEVLAAGGLAPPEPPADAQPAAFGETPSGDEGHRG